MQNLIYFSYNSINFIAPVYELSDHPSHIALPDRQYPAISNIEHSPYVINFSCSEEIYPQPKTLQGANLGPMFSSRPATVTSICFFA